MRLSTRLLLLILGCLLPILGFQIYARYDLNMQRNAGLGKLALHHATLANADLVSIVDGVARLATVVAQFPEVRAADTDCRDRLETVQRSVPGVLFFAVFNGSGGFLCGSGDTSALANDGGAAWVTPLSEQGRTAIGRYASLPDGEAFLPVGVRVGDAESRARMVVAALDLRWLGRHLDQLRQTSDDVLPGSALYVLDHDGTVVGRSPGGPQWIGRTLSTELKSVAGWERSGVMRVTQPDGQVYVVAGIPVAVPPWGLAALEALPQPDLLGDLSQTGWQDVLLTGFVALLVLVLAWATGRRFISRPTQDLMAAAQRWRDGDLSVRADVRRSGSEFATLAQSFNAMASNLQARELERRLHAELLEAQVAERTRALSDMNNRLQVEIAEREKTEAALHQAQKLQAVGQLAGGIAHDFNNMLATVLGSLELMERRVAQSGQSWTEADADRLRTLIERATGAVQRGAQLTSRLLAFSRRQRLAVRPTDVNRLISDLVTLATSTLGRRVRVITELAEDLGSAMVDPSQVEAALLNCCLNARDAMPEGGQVTIATANELVTPGESPDGPHSGHYVRVTIADTGIGMAPDVLRRAFDPFFTTKGPGGSGLGLSQVYGMARQSGGAVRIDSKPGEGTLVTLLLPRASAEAEVEGDTARRDATVRRNAPPSAGTGGGRRPGGAAGHGGDAA